MRTAAIVLAGGASSRFGSDKLAAPLGGRPLLDHALAAAVSVADLVVVVIGPEDPVPPTTQGPGVEVRVARDAVAHQGPLAGLATGLAALAQPGDAPPVEVALVIAGDMPALVPDVLRLLAATLAADRSLGVARLETDPISMLPAAVRPALLAPAAAALLVDDRRSLRGLLGVVRSAVVPSAAWRAVDPRADTLRDVDTPEDLGRR